MRRLFLVMFAALLLGVVPASSVDLAAIGSGAVTRSSASLSADYASTVLADSPVAYWRLSDVSGATAVDASGNGNDSTYLNGVTLGSPGGIFGSSDTSVTLDGVNDRVNRAPVTTQTSNVTLEAWVYWTGCCNSASSGGGRFSSTTATRGRVGSG